MFRVWYSTKDLADWIVDNTNLAQHKIDYVKLAESDANNPAEFHKMPGHLKNILYLDCPDIVIEKEGNPIASVEISKEAGTGHNAFQRFARIAAAVENGVPAIYIYPEATFIRRKNSSRWDRINPNIFCAMERLMQIYNVPALLFYHPTYYSPHSTAGPSGNCPKGLNNDPKYPSAPNSSDPEMKDFFGLLNLIIKRSLQGQTPLPLVNEREVVKKRCWMQSQYINKGGEQRQWSPETAVKVVSTVKLKKFIGNFLQNKSSLGWLLESRDDTVIYQVDAKFRGDPYPGALSALDYMKCRVGKTYEDRDKNLVLAWGNVDESEDTIAVKSSKGSSVDDFMSALAATRDSSRCLLDRCAFSQLHEDQIPRYYMQARYGCMFTKVKHIRVYSFFADAIIFPDGAVWREG